MKKWQIKKKNSLFTSLSKYKSEKDRNWQMDKEPKYKNHEKLQYIYKTHFYMSEFYMSETIIKCIFAQLVQGALSHLEPLNLTEAQATQTSTIHSTEIFNVLELLIAEIYIWKAARKCAKPSHDHRTTSCKISAYYFSEEQEWVKKEVFRSAADTGKNKPKQIELILTSNKQTKDTSWIKHSAATIKVLTRFEKHSFSPCCS